MVEPWYEILGVSPDASADDVRDHYRALVKTWHPDRFATTPERAAIAEERLKAINAAYDESRAVDRAFPYGEPETAAADWPEWFETIEPARVRLLFVPSGIAVRAVALALALLFTFFAVAQAVNALDLVAGK
jgi:hypothetical protein